MQHLCVCDPMRSLQLPPLLSVPLETPYSGKPDQLPHGPAHSQSTVPLLTLLAFVVSVCFGHLYSQTVAS